MKRWQQVALRVVVALGVLVLLLGGAFYWLAVTSLSDMCGNRIVSTEMSPDRAMKAVLFERDCGATTGFSSQVSVLRAEEELPNAGGNAFAANESRGGEATAWGGPFVALHWADAHKLVVKYDSGADVRFKADRVDDIDLVWLVKP